MAKLDYYSLMRAFWDFAFENPELIKPVHCALFAFTVEHCNRLGWKQKFGLPASMVLDAIGIKSYSVYKKTFDDLVDFGFIEVIQYSKNQHSSNVIALKENCKANYKAYDKANTKHVAKQLTKHITTHLTKHGEYNKTNIPITNLPINNEEEKEKIFDNKKNLEHLFSLKNESQTWIETVAMQQKISIDLICEKLDEFELFLRTIEKSHYNKSEFISHFINWLPKNSKPSKIKGDLISKN
jgi:hypothetical protein